MSDKPINNQNLIATRYGFISYRELIEKLDRLEKLETENARLREAIMSCLSGTDTTMSTFITLERALKAIKRGE